MYSTAFIVNRAQLISFVFIGLEATGYYSFNTSNENIGILQRGQTFL